MHSAAAASGTRRRMASSSYMQSRSYEAEIRAQFDVLDDDRTGTITPHALTTLLRSMGHRVTRDDVMAELTAARERRRRRRRQQITAVVTDDDDDEYIGSSCDADQIDVELVLDILSQERYVIGGTSCSSSAKVADLQDTFRLFDVDNKGIITVENLKKVAGEIHAGGGSGTTDTGGGSSSSSSSGTIDDDLLQSMIETFDGNLAEGVNFEQFCRIMGGQP